MKITWVNRYSETLDDDKLGRWGITANVGDYSSISTIFIDGKLSVFELGWIKKLGDKFYFQSNFPFHIKLIFESVDECKLAIEEEFNRFIKIVTK